MRVGGEEPLTVDVRIIAASNRNLQDAIENGNLREDLYYRLKVFQLSLPALRERANDVPLLAQWFLDEFMKVEGTRKRFTPSTLALLSAYAWPGNVRELRNVVHSAHILARETIDVDSLPEEIRTADGHPQIAGSKEERVIAAPGEEPVVALRIGTPIADAERILIGATLAHCGGNKARAAGLLGISLKTLYNRLGSYRTSETGEPSQEPSV
jgi:DNA-binding NtrC family response regulator